MGLYLFKGSLFLFCNRGWLKYYAELYLGIFSSSLRTIRQYISVVLISRIEEEGLSVNICD
jgi:hypothetical protein